MAKDIDITSYFIEYNTRSNFTYLPIDDYKIVYQKLITDQNITCLKIDNGLPRLSQWTICQCDTILDPRFNSITFQVDFEYFFTYTP